MMSSSFHGSFRSLKVQVCWTICLSYHAVCSNCMNIFSLSCTKRLHFCDVHILHARKNMFHATSSFIFSKQRTLKKSGFFLLRLFIFLLKKLPFTWDVFTDFLSFWVFNIKSKTKDFFLLQNIFFDTILPSALCSFFLSFYIV